MEWLQQFADMEWTTAEVIWIAVAGILIGLAAQMVWSAMDDMKQNDEYGG